MVRHEGALTRGRTTFDRAGSRHERSLDAVQVDRAVACGNEHPMSVQDTGGAELENETVRYDEASETFLEAPVDCVAEQPGRIPMPT